ncbi:MAG TPA: SAM-dependent DNA methyltransferase [Nitrospirae bacterium]|nr:SAM-dependent DNA methyltransferase [Nitrospirota bacterium]HDH50849.1 SAM-dependent DNA methyltransferase [Nitrospirota bacterium]
MTNFGEKVSFIWSVADLIRGPYRPNQYKDVMLPLTVLRRLDCVLAPTKDKVLSKLKSLKGGKIKNVEPILNKVSGQSFHNTSKFTFEKLKGDPNNIAANLTQYIKKFSKQARDIIEHFGFEEHISKLDKADRLYLVVSKFCEIDLHPEVVSNLEMGYIFEELIRRFNEASNEEAGDHFTPREVIRLMVDLIFTPDNDVLRTKGAVRTLFDPACGTGGMLSVSEEYLRELNPDARLEVFGQDYNDQAYAICGSDMMIKGQNIDHVQFGNSFTEDHFHSKKFDYMLANPPFGVEWKPEEKVVRKEHEEQGYGGRFGAGLPRINDGSLLFIEHMISKMKDPKEGGTRLAIVFNGSPLFTGGAGSGESEIRKWIIENDWLEAIVAMPDQLFYNTGISTYLWIVTNRKEKKRRGKIQLINATGENFYIKMRKSLGNKRKEIGDGCNGKLNHIAEITRLFGGFKEGEHVRIFDNEDFGYQRITVERPLRLNFVVNEERLDKVKEVRAFVNLATSKKRKDTKAAQAEIEAGMEKQTLILETLEKLKSKKLAKNLEEFSESLKAAFKGAGLSIPAPLFKAILMALSERDETADICTDNKGNPEPDPELRDYENVPLKEDIHKYIEREVLPHVPDAWVDESKTKTGYEINFNRYFYKYTPPRPLEVIETELKQIEAEIAEILSEVTE